MSSSLGKVNSVRRLSDQHPWVVVLFAAVPGIAASLILFIMIWALERGAVPWSPTTGWLSWLVLFGGVLFTGLMTTCVWLVQQAGRQASRFAAEQVRARERLEEEIRERKKTEDRLRQSEGCQEAMGIDVSEAEEALRDSERRLRSFLKNFQGIVYEIRLDDFRPLLLHGQVEQVTGYSRDDFLIGAISWNEIVHPEDKETFDRELEKVASSADYVADLEYRIICRAGEVRWIRDIATSVPPNSTRGQVIQGAVYDLTKSKRIEGERERLFTLSVDLLCVADFDGYVRQVNPAWTRTLGWSDEQLLSRPLIEFVHPDDRGETVQMERKLAVGETILDFENRLMCKDGFYRWISWNSYPLPEAGLVFSVARDVTERKQAEETQRRFATIIEQAAEAVVITDTKGNIQYVNPAFERISGYSSEEAVGKKANITKSGYHDRRFYHELRSAILAGETWKGRITNRRKGGAFYHVDSTISPIRNAPGEVVAYVAIQRDITEEVELQTQLSQAQKMEAIGTLAGGIAHDFNNILQVVLGYTELSLMGEGISPRMAEDLSRVYEAAKGGAELVQRLLTFSRKTEIRPRPISLNRQVQQLQKMLSRTIPKMIEIKLVLAEDLAAVNADPTQIDQILMNLAVNARDAMPDGGALTIETRNVQLDEDYCQVHLDVEPGPYVMLAVADTGHGMDSETIQHIFEPFFTTKGPREGTGLGLATVYGVVKQHGGHVRCYSEPMRGTTFKLYLPALLPEKNLPGIALRPLPRGGTETILLVDDEEFIRDLGTRMLTRAGYNVLAAADGSEALRMYADHREEISLVILDLMMPHMGGKECLLQLRNMNPAIKVIIASGHAADAVMRETSAAGARGAVNKPYEMRQVLEVVRSVLDAE